MAIVIPVVVWAPAAHGDVAMGADDTVVAISALDLPQTLERDRSRLEARTTNALEAAGFEVHGRTATLQKLGGRRDLIGCTSELCLAEVARMTGAALVLVARVTEAKKEYTIAVELFDALGGQVAGSEHVRCSRDALCPPIPEGLSEAVRMAAAKVKIPKNEPSTAVNHSETPWSAPVVALPRAEASPTVLEGEPRPATMSWRQQYRPWGWAAIGSGAGLLALSAFYLVSDGNEAGCEATGTSRRCFKLYDDRGRGILAGVSGAILTGVGIYMLWPSGNRSERSEGGLSVGLGSIMYRGGF